MISVVICTHNRAPLLRQHLRSLVRMTKPIGIEWEVLVVNNGCTDGTSSVIGENLSLLPLREVLEPVLGLSRARNTGVRESCGELVLFTDDDTVVDQGWLNAYISGSDSHPDASFFGGAIIPEYG